MNVTPVVSTGVTRTRGARRPMTGAFARGALRTLVPLGSGSIEKPLTSHGVAPAVSMGAAAACVVARPRPSSTIGRRGARMAFTPA